MRHPFLLAAATMLLGLSSIPAPADPYQRSHWDRGYDNYRTGLSDQDYEIETTTPDAQGNPVTTRTEVERNHDEYTRKTTVTGPDDQYSAQEVEVDYGDSKIKRTTTTTNLDGTVDVQTQRYKVND